MVGNVEGFILWPENGWVWPKEWKVAKEATVWPPAAGDPVSLAGLQVRGTEGVGVSQGRRCRPDNHWRCPLNGR